VEPGSVFGHNGVVPVPRAVGSALAGLVWALLRLAAPALAQINPHTALLEQAGWKALDAGQPEPAATAFRDALAEDPKNPRLHLGAAVAAYAQRRDDEAKTAIDRALALQPALPGARELLGRVLYRSGDLDGAIRVYSALVAGRPPTDPFAQLHDRWRREAELRDRMNVTVGSGFTIAFEGAADTDLAAQALASLERASARIGGLLGVFPLHPVPVVLYTGEQFRDITRAPQWAGGAFDGTIRIPMRGALADAAEFDRVLAHEYTHALVYDLAKRGVPTWLNEGLAAALERDRTPEPPPVAIPLGSLVESFGRFGGAEAQQAYVASAFAVQRLLDAHGGFTMTSLLRDLGDGADFATAFADRFQQPFAEFDSSLR